MTKRKSVTAFEMSEIDRKAQEVYGIPQASLMENAGRSVAEEIIKDFVSIEKESIAIFSGGGNNGGDGFVTARYLFEKSPCKLAIYTVSNDPPKSGAARDNFTRAKKAGLEIRPLKDFLSLDENDIGFTIGIDALFGTGFKGDLPEECKSLGKKLNSSNIKIYAVDIPSGLDATSGRAGKNTPKAVKTITFGLPKQGFFLEKGPDLSGEIIIKDIGFPKELIKQYLAD
ncbi:MAG: NAD(P)H-hydrate epimerase [Candidatus Omnitrophica bacterium]|nr:NAD(P)H-hydrate epimerase [Candidatus Omnitrophota bacterium]